MEDIQNIKKIHFIGIGGVGMSGIAYVANAQGYKVTGSDMRKSYLTDMLVDAGVKVSIGTSEDNIGKGEEKPDIVVVTTAIMDVNRELVAAKAAGIPIWHRAQMLAYLGKNLKTLAVAGTHGKTSTSSMLANSLDAIGEDPTFLIGGVVKQYGANAKYGTGQYYAVEADESDKSFKYLNPYSAIVTNIEADHLDHYEDLQEIYEKFSSFIGSVNKEGYTVVCGDDKKLVDIAKKAHNNVLTYGFGEECDCVISQYQTDGTGCLFTLNLPVMSNTKSKRTSKISINCKLSKNPGKHYALNASGVLVLLDALGNDVEMAAKSLSLFDGTERRFDLVGKKSDITIVDDYAHHPTEIASTIKAALDMDFNNIHVIWQPHRYSRFNLFRDVYPKEFARAFDGCKTLTLTNVFAAGEAPIPGVTGKSFLNIVEDNKTDDTPETFYVEQRLDLASHIIKIAKPGDLILTMGAGDITMIGRQILKALD